MIKIVIIEPDVKKQSQIKQTLQKELMSWLEPEYFYVSKVVSPGKGIIMHEDDLSDNINDTENMCWIYDCDYTYLADPSIKQVVFAGPRCYDHYIRGLMAGVPAEKMLLTREASEGAKLIDTNLCKDIFVLYDLYLNKEANATKKALVQRGQEGA